MVFTRCSLCLEPPGPYACVQGVCTCKILLSALRLMRGTYVGCNVAVQVSKYCAKSALIKAAWLQERRPIVRARGTWLL